MKLRTKFSNFYFYSLIFGLLFTIMVVPVRAQQSPSFPSTSISQQQEFTVLQQQLNVVDQANVLRQMRSQQLQKRQTRTPDLIRTEVTDKQLGQAKLDVAITKADLATVTQELSIAKQRVKHLQEALHVLENQLQELQLTSADRQVFSDQENIMLLQLKVDQQRSIYELENQQIQALVQAQQLLQQIILQEENWVTDLKESYVQQRKEARQQTLAALTTQIRTQQQLLLKQLTELREKEKTFVVSDQTTSVEAIDVNIRIFRTEQEINLNQLKLTITNLSVQFETLMEKTLDKDIVSLNDARDQSNSIVEELKDLSAMVTSEMTLLRDRQRIQKEMQTRQILSTQQLETHDRLLKEQINRYEKQKTVLNGLRNQVQHYQDNVERELKHVLSQRRGLPGLQPQLWLSLGGDLTKIPVLTLQWLDGLKEQLSIFFEKMTAIDWMIFIVVELLWLSLWSTGRHYLKVVVTRFKENRHRMSANVVYVATELLRRNLTILLISLAIWSAFLIAKIPFKSYALLIYLILVWFGFRFFQGITRISLVETMGDTSGRDVKLYHRLKWTLMLGGVVTALVIISYQLPVAYEVRGLLNHLLMLFLLIVSFVLWKGRDVIPSLLETYIHVHRTYLIRIVRLLCVLIPIIVLLDAVVGLLGYVQLAWKMSVYQIIFLIVASLYILVRGLWVDLTDSFSTLFIRHLKNGWLWSEAFLKPFDRIIRIVLFLSGWFFLFLWYGKYQETSIINEINQAIHYQLLDAAGTQVTLLSIVEIIIIAAVIFWAARWTREFAYRWLFTRTRDRSLRNSLAIFSQYTMVIIGIVIMLRVIGISFTMLSVILGGLAVGIGFGLRDLANDFVSGILLLVERPVREGDLVSMGGHEGEVIHIGMRSMIVKTWDHMEVLVPNSEVFSKAFVNWTRQDSIVRTVISIKMHRHDNPYRIQSLIFDVLTVLPSVLSEPAPQIYMKEIDDALIEFEVRYFIDLHAGKGRPAVRSEVLFNIWEQFKEHGIKAPFPQQELHIESVPSVMHVV